MHLRPEMNKHIDFEYVNDETYLLVEIRSDELTSSATISKNSKICSGPAPPPDNVVTTERIQSGHRGGRPGTSLRAREVICSDNDLVVLVLIIKGVAYCNKEFSESDLALANCYDPVGRSEQYVDEWQGMFLRKGVPIAAIARLSVA